MLMVTQDENFSPFHLNFLTLRILLSHRDGNEEHPSELAWVRSSYQLPRPREGMDHFNQIEGGLALHRLKNHHTWETSSECTETSMSKNTARGSMLRGRKLINCIICNPSYPLSRPSGPHGSGFEKVKARSRGGRAFAVDACERRPATSLRPGRGHGISV